MSDRSDCSLFHLKPVNKPEGFFFGNSKSPYIPKKDCNTEDGSSSETLNVNQYLTFIEQERNRLLSECGYKSYRSNDINRYLYLKPAFILKNIPDFKKDRQAILHIYLADLGALFTYSDECYWQRQVSGQIVSVRRALNYSTAKRKQLVEGLSVWTETLLTDEQIIPASDKNLHTILINRIFEKAGKSPGFVKWVETHICQAVPSDNERMAIIDTSGLTDQALAQFRKIVRFIISDNLCRIYLPNSEAYQQAEQNLSLFQELMPEYQEKITPQFCRTFVNFVLTDYMQEYKLATDPQCHPDHVSDEDKLRSIALFYLYKIRLQKLNQLQEGFSREPISVLNSANGAPFAFAFAIKKCSEVDAKIGNVIRGYFMEINQPLKEDSRHHYLEQRVHWAMEERTVAQSMRPVFLLYMAICCKQNLVSDHTITISRRSNTRWYIGPKRDYPKQRYAQLKLLDELYEILAIEKPDQYENWNQFFVWAGKHIMSPEEAKFWRKHLDVDDYNQLPAIGFQLCCLNYLEDCLSAHIEDLSYTAGSRLHLGGYCDFFNRNQDLIKKQTKLMEKVHPKLVKEYRKLWSNPRNNFVNGIQWLEDQLEDQDLIDLREFRMETEYDPAELKRLILETELRLCVCYEARKALIHLCEDTYNLDPRLFKEFL